MSCRRCLIAILPIAVFALGGCIGPFSWRSNPPWLTPWMGEGELARDLAKNIPLGATREDVLKNLDRRGVKPFDELDDDGTYRAEKLVAAVEKADPQFRVELSYNLFPHLNHNYYIERQDRIAILMVTYRGKPPNGMMVYWAESIGSEVIIEFADDQVRSVVCRPLESEASQKLSPHFKIENLR